MPEVELVQEDYTIPIYHPGALKFLDRKSNKGKADRIQRFFDQKALQIYESGGIVPASWTPFRHPEAKQGYFCIGTNQFGAIVKVLGTQLEVINIGSNVEEVIDRFR